MSSGPQKERFGIPISIPKVTDGRTTQRLIKLLIEEETGNAPKEIIEKLPQLFIRAVSCYAACLGEVNGDPTAYDRVATEIFCDIVSAHADFLSKYFAMGKQNEPSAKYVFKVHRAVIEAVGEKMAKIRTLYNLEKFLQDASRSFGEPQRSWISAEDLQQIFQSLKKDIKLPDPDLQVSLFKVMKYFLAAIFFTIEVIGYGVDHVDQLVNELENIVTHLETFVSGVRAVMAFDCDMDFYMNVMRKTNTALSSVINALNKELLASLTQSRGPDVFQGCIHSRMSTPCTMIPRELTAFMASLETYVSRGEKAILCKKIQMTEEDDEVPIVYWVRLFTTNMLENKRGWKAVKGIVECICRKCTAMKLSGALANHFDKVMNLIQDDKSEDWDVLEAVIDLGMDLCSRSITTRTIESLDAIRRILYFKVMKNHDISQNKWILFRRVCQMCLYCSLSFGAHLSWNIAERLSVLDPAIKTNPAAKVSKFLVTYLDEVAKVISKDRCLTIGEETVEIGLHVFDEFMVERYINNVFCSIQCARAKTLIDWVRNIAVQTGDNMKNITWNCTTKMIQSMVLYIEENSENMSCDKLARTAMDICCLSQYLHTDINTDMVAIDALKIIDNSGNASPEAVNQIMLNLRRIAEGQHILVVPNNDVRTTMNAAFVTLVEEAGNVFGDISGFRREKLISFYPTGMRNFDILNAPPIGSSGSLISNEIPEGIPNATADIANALKCPSVQFGEEPKTTKRKKHHRRHSSSTDGDEQQSRKKHSRRLTDEEGRPSKRHSRRLSGEAEPAPAEDESLPKFQDAIPKGPATSYVLPGVSKRRPSEFTLSDESDVSTDDDEMVPPPAPLGGAPQIFMGGANITNCFLPRMNDFDDDDGTNVKMPAPVLPVMGLRK